MGKGGKYVFNGDITGSSIGDAAKSTNYFGAAPETSPTDAVPAASGANAPSWRDRPAEVVEYDLAFSFAAPDRAYVEATKRACDRLRLKVMYDRDLSNEYWGENRIVKQREIYGRRTLFFVPFISGAYFNRPIPRDEFAAAMATDVARGGGYILPVIIGKAEIPPGQLHPHTGWLEAERFTPELLAQQLQWKVRGAKNARQQFREVADIVADAMNKTDDH